METYTTLVKGETICIRNANDEPFIGADDSEYEIWVQRYNDGSMSITTHDLESDAVDFLKESDIRNYMIEVRNIFAQWDAEEGL